MTDRAEAMAFVKQALDDPDERTSGSRRIPYHHLRALIEPPSEELVERVARAICEADHHAAWPGDSYNDRAQKRQYMKEARAAIAVIHPID
jgi:hypothetical protein